MPSAEIRNPDGCPVTLSPSRWAHITDPDWGHPEMAELQAEVLRAVQMPDRRRGGHASNEDWFYLGNVGPSRWIKVVVIYEGDRGSIITAFPRRSFP